MLTQPEFAPLLSAGAQRKTPPLADLAHSRLSAQLFVQRFLWGFCSSVQSLVPGLYLLHITQILFQTENYKSPVTPVIALAEYFIKANWFLPNPWEANRFYLPLIFQAGA